MVPDEAAAFGGGLFIGVLLGGIVCGSVCSCDIASSYQRQAIEHNAAEYDQVTGEWRWKEPKKSLAGGE